MPISTPTASSRTFGTTEWSLLANEAGPVDNTERGLRTVMLDLSALADGDIYRVRGYERVAASDGARRIFAEHLLIGPAVDPAWSWSTPVLEYGGDVTLAKVSGTDRAIAWRAHRIY